MISSISAQDTNLFTSSSTFQNTSVTATGKQEEKEEEESTATATSADGDTLEISAAGTNYVQKTYTGTSKSSGVTKDEGYSSATAQTVASAAASMGINEYTAEVDEASASSTSTGSSSSDSTSNLSQYSEAELKEMLEDGEITQSEYNAEIASRQTESTDEEEEEASSVIQSASATEESDT